MLEWFQENPWALWLTLAAGLAIAEMLTLDLTLLMLAVGALVGVGAALLLPGVLWVQIAAALVVAVLMLGLIRPSLLKRLQRGPGYRSQLDRVIGSSGTVTREVTASGGEVKVAGEAWSARSYDGETIPVGALIDVFEIDGVTLVVHPKDQLLPPS
jgi:membrane protein implicated in regulation of membrane protease activity